MKRSARSRAAELMGRKGRKIRKAQFDAMTPEQRSEEMRKVALARYKKKSEPDVGTGAIGKEVSGSEIAAEAI